MPRQRWPDDRRRRPEVTSGARTSNPVIAAAAELAGVVLLVELELELELDHQLGVDRRRAVATATELAGVLLRSTALRPHRFPD